MPQVKELPAVEEGAPAPDFTLPSTDGQKVKLRDFKGKKSVVLYFYPKDDTPGCTKEACDFRDSIKKIQAAGAEVFGVSFDSLESHKKFIEKFKLPFPLLSDDDKAVAQAYGVYKQKTLYGRSYMGIERTTFVIDRNQKVRKIFPKVKVEGHVEEVLSALKPL